MSTSLWGSKNVLVYTQKDRRRRTIDCFVFHVHDKTTKAENCSISDIILNTIKISFNEISACSFFEHIQIGTIQI